MANKIKKKEYPSETAVQLISHLSEGAYTTFAKAVKELVINAFDADASEVRIDFDKDFSSLILLDDGDGMSSKRFKTEFLRIAGSKRRLESRKRKYNRPMVGRFGIGFLSVARLCKTVKVYSKEKGNNFGIAREIPLEHLFDKGNQLKNLKEQYYFYSFPDFRDDKKKSYTKIILSGLRQDIQEDLKSVKKFKDVWGKTDDLCGIDKFKWELGTLLPVRYFNNFPAYRLSNSQIERAKQELDEFSFRVFVNKNEILKPICLGYHYFTNAKWEYPTKLIPRNQCDIIPIMSPPGEKFKFYGYIYNQSKQIQPSSLRGILLRINHIGIKGYSKSLFEFTKNIGPILPAISGEIFLDPVFEEVLTLDKDDFKEDHPLFKDLVGYIHDAIDEVATISRRRSSRIKAKKKEVSRIRDLDLSSKEVKQAQKILGRKEFKQEYFPNPDISIRTNIKNLKTRIRNLVGKTIDQDEASYLIESLECFEADCFRGSILMAWNTGMFRIHRKIEKNIGFAKFQNEIIRMRTSLQTPQVQKSRLKNCNSLDDLKYYNEEMICRLLEKIQLMDGITAKLFYEVLIKIRHYCAHPTGHRATDGEAVFMIQSVLDRILNSNKFIIK
jgi:hypothetical protein